MDISILCIFLLSTPLLASVKAKPQVEDSSERFNGRRFNLHTGDFPFDVQDRQPNKNDEIESRSLDLLRLEALAGYTGNQFGGLHGSRGGFPASQTSNGITGQNANQRIDRGLFNAFPHPLNGLLSPQGLVGAAPGLIGTNQNLIGGQSGLLGGLPGLVAGTSGGNASPLGLLPGRSPIGDIMAMASFLTKDELNDMFSQDKNFNFIPVILQDSKEEQEVEQFIRFLNKRTEKEKESLETSNNEFDTNPLLAQQIRGNALQRLTQQNPIQRLAQNNLLQPGLNPLLLSPNLLQSGTPNPILSQQNALQGSGINSLLALQSQQNALQGSGINPLLALQSQQNGLQRSGLSPLLALQSQQNALQGSGINPPLALQSQQNSLQESSIDPLLALQTQLQSNPYNGFSEPFLSQLQNNQADPNRLGLNPLVQQALLQKARLQQSLQSQQPQLQGLQQLILRQARDSELRHEREISARLPAQHKQEPFRFPRD